MITIKSFLLVVDIQKGFIDKTTLFVKTRIDELLDKNIFDCVIATVYQNYNGSPISQLMGWGEMKTDKEQAVTGESVKADRFVYKTTYSAFSDSLTEYLKSENNDIMPECIFIAGVDTECCVLMTAAGFFEAGIRPIVLTHYCGSSKGEESHNAGIISMKSIIGENNLSDEIISTKEDIKNALTRAKANISSF